MDYYTEMQKTLQLHTTWLNLRHKVEENGDMHISYGFIYTMVKAGKPRL